MVDVREATRADRTAIREVHVASVRGLAPEAYSGAVVDAWVGDENRDPRQYRVEGEDVVFLVAVDDGEVVGFGESTTNQDATATYDIDTDAEVRAVYVAPDYAGEGVGTALLDELEARGQNRGVSTIALTASLNAVGFYESHDYERVETTEHEFGGEETGEAVVMRKRL
ncbi:MAG: GNAT family N-acetyltransferase [Halolamina sp.]